MPSPAPAGPVLACDVGGTVTKLAIVADGLVLARTDLASESASGLEPRLDPMASAIRDLFDAAGVPVADCLGAAIAIPGIVDRSGGRVVHINEKFADAPGLDLPRWALDELGLPAVVENDARAAAIGEWRHGAGQGCEDFVAVTLGTGIGVAAVCDGRMLRGPHGGAGIIGGHQTVAIDGRRCNCGRRGCAEAEASTWALPGLVRDLGDEHDTSRLRAPDLDYAALIELAHQGDAAAIELRQRSFRIWGALLVDLVHAYDPDRVVIGGGIAKADELLPFLRTALDRDPWSSDWEVEIVRSRLGADAALVAAPWILAEQRGP